MADEPECRDQQSGLYEKHRAIAENLPLSNLFHAQTGAPANAPVLQRLRYLLPDCYPQYFEDEQLQKNRWEPSEYARSHFARPLADAAMTSWPALSRDGKTRGSSDLSYSAVRFSGVVIMSRINLYAWFDSHVFISDLDRPHRQNLMLLRDYMLEKFRPGGVRRNHSVHLLSGRLEIHDGKLCLIAVNNHDKSSDVPLKTIFRQTVQEVTAAVK